MLATPISSKTYQIINNLNGTFTLTQNQLEDIQWTNKKFKEAFLLVSNEVERLENANKHLASKLALQKRRRKAASKRIYEKYINPGNKPKTIHKYIVLGIRCRNDGYVHKYYVDANITEKDLQNTNATFYKVPYYNNSGYFFAHLPVPKRLITDFKRRISYIPNVVFDMKLNKITHDDRRP